MQWAIHHGEEELLFPVSDISAKDLEEELLEQGRLKRLKEYCQEELRDSEIARARFVLRER